MRLWIVLVALLLSACATAPTATPPPEQPGTESTLPPAEPPTQAPLPEPWTEVPDPTVAPAVATDIPGDLIDLPTQPVETAIHNDLASLPLPGTIQVVPQTEEAQPGGSVYYSITYEESGGLSDSYLELVIYMNGEVYRNGEQISVSPDVIAAAEQAVRQLNVFNIEGVFTVLSPPEEAYLYTLRVEREDGTAKSINADDQAAPQQLLQLFAQLRTIGLES